MGMAQSAHGVDHMHSNECLLADPVSHTDDEEAGILGRVLYKAEFGDLENNHVNYDTILWILISLPLIMAWGIGVFMLLFLPMRRYIIRKDIRSRMLCVTSHAIVYKVTRPMFLPFLGVTRAEKHVPLSLITDIVIEQGCLQAKYGLHTIRVENLANGNSKPVDEFQIQGVVNPKHFMEVILREASKFRMDVSLGREQRAHNLCLPSQAIPISELSKEIPSKHPSSIQMRNKYLWKSYGDVKSMMRRHYSAWDETGCTILCDGWTDKRDRTLLNFIVESSAGTMFFKSIDASGKVKDTAFLVECFEETIAQIGANRVVQIITDNAAAFVSAGATLERLYPSLYWSPCAAHCIDLLLEDLSKLDWIARVVRKSRYLSRFIYARNLLHHLFLKFSEKKEIVRPGMTRFATNFLLLQSLMGHKVAIMQMFVSTEYTMDPDFRIIRDSPEGRHCKDRIAYDDTYFWDVMRDVIEIASPLVKVLHIADGDTPPMGYIYEAMKRAKVAIKEAMEKQGRGDAYRTDVCPLIHKRWTKMLHTDLQGLGNIFNPKYGLDQGDRIDNDEALRLAFPKVVVRLYKGDSPEIVLFRRKLMMEFSIYKRPKTAPKANPLVSIDQEDSKFSASEDHPEQWWENYGSFDLPNLAKFAKRILTQPVSASGCERNWSVFEHIHSKKRNKLAHDRLSALVYIHYNLSKFIKFSHLSKALDLDDIDPSMPASRWLIEGTHNERDEEPHIDYGSDPEPTLDPDSRVDVICLAPLLGELQVEDAEVGGAETQGSTDPSIQSDAAVGEAPPDVEPVVHEEQHVDDDDDVFGLLDSLPRGPGDRFTIEDLVPMDMDLPVDPTSLLPPDDDAYGGDELDVPESSSGRKRRAGRPPKQYARKGAGASGRGRID